MKRDEAGIALPVCLGLAALTAIAALQALYTANAELRLAGAVGQQQRLFELAESGITSGFSQLSNDPASLPDDGLIVPLKAPSADLTVSVSKAGEDALCPMFTSGVRSHYVITATATLADRQRIHRRGLFVCSDTCAAPGCTPAMTPVTVSWWSYL